MGQPEPSHLPSPVALHPIQPYHTHPPHPTTRTRPPTPLPPPHPTTPHSTPPTPRSIIKREVEERLGSHGEFGRVSFARLSFGRQPPVITGVKGVPLRDGETLAMGKGCFAFDMGEAPWVGEGCSLGRAAALQQKDGPGWVKGALCVWRRLSWRCCAWPRPLERAHRRWGATAGGPFQRQWVWGNRLTRRHHHHQPPTTNPCCFPLQ